MLSSRRIKDVRNQIADIEFVEVVSGKRRSK